MADTATAAATAQTDAATQSGNTGAATAPDLTTLQTKLAEAEKARLAAEALAAQKAAEAQTAMGRYANLEKSHGRLAQEVGVLRQQVGSTGATTDTLAAAGIDGVQQNEAQMLRDLTLYNAFCADPRYRDDYYANHQQVTKLITEDPSLQALDPFTRHVQALERVRAGLAAAARKADLEHAKTLETQLAEANAKLSKVNESRQQAASHAQVSGVSFAPLPEGIDEAKLASMSSEEIAKLAGGRGNVMRGLLGG